MNRVFTNWLPATAIVVFSMSSLNLAFAGTESVNVVQAMTDLPGLGVDLSADLTLVDGRLVLRANASHASFYSPTLTSPFPFNAVGTHWLAELPDGAQLEIFIRLSLDAAAWSEWILIPEYGEVIAETTEDGWLNSFAGDRIGGMAFADARSRYLQYRVDFVSAPAGSPALQRVAFNFINSINGPTTEQMLQAANRRQDTRKTQGVPKPRIFLRSEWGARSPSAGYRTTIAQRIAFHHTAFANDWNVESWDDCAARMRAIQSFHMDSNGWIDIGYNYGICKLGHIFQAREDNNDGNDVHGAHDGYNAGSMGVVNLGYFHSPYNQVPSQEQLSALYQLMAWKCDERGFDPLQDGFYSAYGARVDNIYGHREVRATACPGDRLFALKSAIRDSVARIIDGAVTTIAEPSIHLPHSPHLWQSYPNPFVVDHNTGDHAHVMRIRFDLPAAGAARLSIYNSLGQQLIVLQEGTASAGKHVIAWNGRGSHGVELPAGVYFCRLESAGLIAQRKIVLIRTR